MFGKNCFEKDGAQVMVKTVIKLISDHESQQVWFLFLFFFETEGIIQAK